MSKLIEAAVEFLSRDTSTKQTRREEVEVLDELKKSTLASYAKKATRDARIKMATGKDFERHAITSRKPEYRASAKEWEDKYKSAARRREAGVNKAIDRLAKEEVEDVREGVQIKPSEFHAFRRGEKTAEQIASDKNKSVAVVRGELNLHADHWSKGKDHYNKLFKVNS